MTLQDMAQVWASDEWAEQYDHAGEQSNDYAMRAGYPVERIARRNNRKVANLAECGHCGRTLDLRTRKATAHVIACESENRAYAYGRS